MLPNVQVNMLGSAREHADQQLAVRVTTQVTTRFLDEV